MEYSAAYRLAEEIRHSEEYTTYHDLHDRVMGDETQAALIREYKRLQMSIQMKMLSGQGQDADDQQRFNMLTALLYGKPEVNQYLLAEIRLQQALADIMKIVTDATGLDIQLPG